MPNHVTTRCTVDGDAGQLSEFRRLMFVMNTNEHSGQAVATFDFNAILPMPEILRGSDEGSRSEEGAALLILRGARPAPFATGGLYDHQISRIRADVGMPKASIDEVATVFLAKHPDWEEEGRRRLRAVLETGYASWYPWSIANWGTKWGAYSFEPVSEDPFVFKFETAWSFPAPIFDALARRFAALTFTCVCFDEGWNFAGRGSFNPKAGGQAFAICDATDEIYQEVYGRPPEAEED